MKTSEEWYNLFCKDIIMIYDPDGWDRKNYQYSYYEELIDLTEFRNRLALSTICGVDKFIEMEQKMKAYDQGYVIISRQFEKVIKDE